MSLIYSLGLIIPFIIILKTIYLKYFKDEKKAFLFWSLHLFFTIVGAKLFYIFFHNKDLTIILKPYGHMGIGLVLFAYFYLFCLGMIFKINPKKLWNELSIVAPIGIILIRTGNILNKEVEGIINYATIEIIYGFISLFLLLKFKKLRENATLFMFFSYYFVRLFIAEPLRGIKFFSLNYLYAILFAIVFLATYIFVDKLEKKNLFRNSS